MLFCLDQKQFSSLVVWLEDIKIRLYKIDDRTTLRDTENKQWPAAFTQVCQRHLNLVKCLTIKLQSNLVPRPLPVHIQVHSFMEIFNLIVKLQ